MAEALIYKLHEDALHLISDVFGPHVEGLQAGARLARRQGLVSNKLFKRLTIVDNAFSLQRHITRASANQIMQALENHLATRSASEYLTTDAEFSDASSTTATTTCPTPRPPPHSASSPPVRDLVSENATAYFNLYETGEDEDASFQNYVMVPEASTNQLLMFATDAANIKMDALLAATTARLNALSTDVRLLTIDLCPEVAKSPFVHSDPSMLCDIDIGPASPLASLTERAVGTLIDRARAAHVVDNLTACYDGLDLDMASQHIEIDLEEIGEGSTEIGEIFNGMQCIHRLDLFS
mmetsp:Transcript_130021/g.324057  ORF Transcript_130021/g.324057 Transcript_130021/m.324057 type:complete len:296 (+) Transcript_130021:130-1017(+)